MNNSKVVGIDIGGSHITAAIVDLENRAVLPGTLVRNRVDSHAPAATIITEWSKTIRQVSELTAGVSKKIGLAMPGPFDYEQGICLIQGLDKYEKLYKLNVKQLLAQELDIEEAAVLMMNDASCFLQGEIFGGAVIGCNNVIGVTLGTGLGSARFHDGVIYDGDLYYTPFRNGTAEDFISSRWFVRKYAAITGKYVKDVKELCDMVSGDPAIQMLFDEFGKNLGEVLSKYIIKHNCETIVAGGNIINAWELFFRETEKVLNRLPKPILIRRALLGEESALVGAASLWK
ncbi:MAG: ROK family protein [Ferruginibacter sp.]